MARALPPSAGRRRRGPDHGGPRRPAGVFQAERQARRARRRLERGAVEGRTCAGRRGRRSMSMARRPAPASLISRAGARPCASCGARFEPDDLKGAALAIADAESAAEAEAFRAAAQAFGAPVNIIDKPAFSDFQFGAIVDRSPLVIAISTDGASPVLAQALRGRIEAVLPRGRQALGGGGQRLARAVCRRWPSRRSCAGASGSCSARRRSPPARRLRAKGFSRSYWPRPSAIPARRGRSRSSARGRAIPSF